MGTSSVRVWIGLGLAALGIGLVAAASSSSSPPTPVPTNAPWTIKQGERYRVTVTETGSGSGTGFNPSINWTPIVQAALDAVAPGGYHVVSSTVTTQVGGNLDGNLVFVVDALGSTHNEPSASFTSFSFPSPLSVTAIDDLGPTPATAGLVAPAPAPSPPVGSSAPTHPLPVLLPPPGVPLAPTHPLPVLLPPPAPPGAAPPQDAGPQGPTQAQLTAASNFSFLTGGSAQWVQGATVSAGGRGRVTIAANSAPPVLANFILWIKTSNLPNLFGWAFFVWGPNDALPPDWPSDDVNAGPGAGYHFEFVSQNAAAQIGVADIVNGMSAAPAAVAMWSAQGSGPAQLTRPIVLNWNAVTQLDPGAHVRMTIAQGDLATIAQAVGLTGAISAGPSACAGLSQLVQFAGFDQIVTNGTTLVLTWCGSDFLPPDWPSSDSLGEYHLEFRVLAGGGSSAPISNLPFPVLGAWAAQGPGA